MASDLPPYQGQNWLCLTDAEVLLLGGVMMPSWLAGKVQRLTVALEQRLAVNATLPQPAEALPADARTDRSGLLIEE
jgi:hypothetical protein